MGRLGTPHAAACLPAWALLTVTWSIDISRENVTGFRLFMARQRWMTRCANCSTGSRRQGHAGRIPPQAKGQKGGDEDQADDES